MKAIIYGAKSSPDERGSIDSQIEACRSFAEGQGWDVEAVYSDEAKSAYSGSRGDGLAAAKEHAARIGGALLVYASDRLARGDAIEAAHLIEYALEAKKCGYVLASVTEPLIGELSYAAVLGDRAHMDSKAKSDHVRRAMEREARKGRYLGSRKPYGYRFKGKREERGLEIEPTEAKTISRMAEWYEGGAGDREIAARLNAEGIPSPLGVAWEHSTVANLLRSPIMAGFVHRHGEPFPGLHEAIIDPERWRRLQEIRETRRGKGRRPQGSHVFTGGVLRCPECRSALRPRTTPKGYAFYECSVGGCGQSSINARMVEGLILESLLSLVFDPDETRTRIETAADGERERARKMIARADRALREIERKRQRIEGDYLDKELPAKLYKSAAARLDSEAAQAQAYAAELEEAAQSAVDEAADLDAEQEVIARLERLQEVVRGQGDTESIEVVRQAISSTFERVYLQEGEKPGKLVVIPVLRREAVAALGAEVMIRTRDGKLTSRAEKPRKQALPDALGKGREPR